MGVDTHNAHPSIYINGVFPCEMEKQGITITSYDTSRKTMQILSVDERGKFEKKGGLGVHAM